MFYQDVGPDVLDMLLRHLNLRWSIMLRSLGRFCLCARSLKIWFT